MNLFLQYIPFMEIMCLYNVTKLGLAEFKKVPMKILKLLFGDRVLDFRSTSYCCRSICVSFDDDVSSLVDMALNDGPS